MTAALLGNKQPGDLALHPRGDQNRPRLSQRLHPRREVGRVAENFARRIHHNRSGVEADAGVERRLAGGSVPAVELGKSALERERCARGALGIVLLRHRIAEQRHQPVAELLGDMPAHLGHRRRSGIEVGADEVAPLLGVEPRGNAGRTDEVAEHHSEIAPLAGRFGRDRGRIRRCSRCSLRRDERRYGRRCDRRRHRGGAQFGDGREYFPAMPERDADVLEILIRQKAEYRDINFILGKALRVLPETKLSKPVRNLLHAVPRRLNFTTPPTAS